ncbi:TPA: fimbria/pilus outer membrane usher protein [Aeromonas veronii]
MKYKMRQLFSELFFMSKSAVYFPTRSFLVVFIILFSGGLLASEDELEFEASFMRQGKNGASPIVFQYQNAIIPGRKTVDVYINDRLVERQEVDFVENTDKKSVSPCFSQTKLHAFGIKTHLYEGWSSSLDEEDDSATPQAQCDSLTARIPMSRIDYDETHQVLRLTVPQEAVNSERFQMISPLEWDNGTPSLRANYSGYVYKVKQKGSAETTANNTSTNSFFSLNTIATAGPWRLYSFDTFNKGSAGWESNHDRLYVERDIVPLQAKISMGDIYSYSPSSIMGSIPLRGVNLITNERMMLESQFTYSPVIRGIAKTNARLIVRQQGNIIYSKTITPGNFAIDDLSTGQIGADLDVTVEESDGTVQRFTVPYTALPNMIRPDATRYSLSFGEFRGGYGTGDKPLVGTLGLERGFDALTLNSSVLGSQDYQSLALGTAWNAGGIGAFSFDIAQAHYKQSWGLPGDEAQSKNGLAIRQLYAKQFDASDTGLRILGYQYRSKDFLEFSEFISRSNYDGIGSYESGDSLWNKRRRSRIEVNINQGLRQLGNLYLSFSQDRFYESSQKSTSASAGYGFLVGKANLNLAYIKTKQGEFNDDQLSLGVSYPLSWGENDRNFSSVNYNTVRDKNNRYSHSVGYSGAIADSGLSYGSSVQRAPTGDMSESLSLGYTTRYASFSSQVGRSDYSDQASFGIAGGVVLYKGGAVLSQSLGDTIGIVETPGATDVKVNGGGKTDLFGHAVVTYLSPYRYNTVSVDSGDSEGVELKESTKKVVPTEGAAVIMNFATRVGRRAMVEIRGEQSIPIGASVEIEGQGEEAGIVGNNQLAYLTGLDARKDESLIVRWRNKTEQQCRFTLPRLTEEEVKLQAQQWHKRVVATCL